MKSNAPGAERIYACSCFIYSVFTPPDQQASPELDKRFNDRNTLIRVCRRQKLIYASHIYTSHLITEEPFKYI